MSVVLVRQGRLPAEVLRGHEGFGLVALTVDVLEALEQRLVVEPLADEPDHAVVIGVKTGGRKRAMAKAAVWVIRPPDAYPPVNPLL
jgi:hypothetical protein